MKKHTYNYIKEYIENDEGYKLLSKEYFGAHNKLKLQCNMGHNFEMQWAAFQQGQRCPICFGNKKLTYKHIKEQIKKKGYKLLSKEYKNSTVKLNIQCDKKHTYKVTYNDFQQGYRCPVCFGTPKHSYKFIKEQFEKEEYKLLSKIYISTHNKLKVQCNKGHRYEVTYGNFRQGCRCPICNYNKTSSKAELKIQKYLKKNDINFIANDRTQIINPLTGYSLELDIWIPELNKAIEFNGTYWHSSNYSKFKDKIKVEQCKEKGINLLVIQEQKSINNYSEVLYNFIGGV